MIKIKEYKVKKQGLRGFSVAIPKVWIEDNNLSQGDSIEFYRDEKDNLILSAKKNDSDPKPAA